jgi:hypothetical protein
MPPPSALARPRVLVLLSTLRAALVDSSTAVSLPAVFRALIHYAPTIIKRLLLVLVLINARSFPLVWHGMSATPAQIFLILS